VFGWFLPFQRVVASGNATKVLRTLARPITLVRNSYGIVRRPFSDGSSSHLEVTDPSRHQVERFETLFVTNRLDILKYLVRRCVDTDEAADALAETFIVAWRRIDVVPTDSRALWLFGVARNLFKLYKKRQLSPQSMNDWRRNSDPLSRPRGMIGTEVLWTRHFRSCRNRPRNS